MRTRLRGECDANEAEQRSEMRLRMDGGARERWMPVSEVQTRGRGGESDAGEDGLK